MGHGGGRWRREIAGVLLAGAFTDSARPNVNGWACGGAVAGFIVVLLFVAWRIVVAGCVGIVIGTILGGIIGPVASPNDGAPVDWGLVIGAIVGAVAGVVIGMMSARSGTCAVGAPARLELDSCPRVHIRRSGEPPVT